MSFEREPEAWTTPAAKVEYTEKYLKAVTGRAQDGEITRKDFFWVLSGYHLCKAESKRVLSDLVCRGLVRRAKRVLLLQDGFFSNEKRGIKILCGVKA